MPNRYPSKYSMRSPATWCGQAMASLNGSRIFSAAGSETMAKHPPLTCGCAASRRGRRRQAELAEGMAVAVAAVVVLALFVGWLVVWLVVLL